MTPEEDPLCIVTRPKETEYHICPIYSHVLFKQTALGGISQG